MLGNAGEVTITGLGNGSIFLQSGSYISSETVDSSGDAGKVEISHVGSILIKGDSYISSETFDSFGDAKLVRIEDVGVITINGN